jgi:hypothetical protein
MPESFNSLPIFGALLGLPNRVSTPLEKKDLGLTGPRPGYKIRCPL